MKNSKLVRSVLIPFAVFFLILMVMNGYQYLKVKKDLTEGLVKEIGNVEMRELQQFIAAVEERLLLIRDWGENDVLLSGDIPSLNSKFMPLLERMLPLSGIILANSSGREYYIYKDQETYVTRTTSVEGGVALMKFVEWSPDSVVLKQWEKYEEYDPRQRPWFEVSTGDSAIHWTGFYSFFQSKQPGVTVSASWRGRDDEAEVLVLGIDISLSDIKKFLAQRDAQRTGLLFLTKGDGAFWVTGQADGTLLSGDNEHGAVVSLIKRWRLEGYPSKEVIPVKLDSQNWLGSFREIEHASSTFWLGLAVSESEMLERLNRKLFRIDLIEVAIALVGSGCILLILLKYGPYRDIQKEILPPERRFFDYIKEGEGPEVEYKSTVRTNIKSGKHGKEIELAWLKGVVAFLNSNGGAVLLGVDDSGEVVGIAEDQFENADRCLLHIKNLLNQHIGAEFSAFILTTPVEYQEKQVVMIECRAVGEPVFLKIGKNEEFYVRSGPSSIKLSPSQTVSYIQQNN